MPVPIVAHRLALVFPDVKQPLELFEVRALAVRRGTPTCTPNVVQL